MFSDEEHIEDAYFSNIRTRAREYGRDTQQIENLPGSSSGIPDLSSLPGPFPQNLDTPRTSGSTPMLDASGIEAYLAD